MTANSFAISVLGTVKIADHERTFKCCTHLRLGVPTEEERPAFQQRPQVAGREREYICEASMQIVLH